MPTLRYHFSGIAGAGMNPLARLMRAWGHQVQGSDRSIDQGANAEVAASLRALGIVLHRQDGSAITAGIDRVVYSTAVETQTAELTAARALGLSLVPRPALLAELVDGGGPGVAIAGTSGKSTVTGMLAWVLRQAGVDASVLGGAGLVGDGPGGCFAIGAAGAPVVAEACESDGTLVGYHPGVGIVHNISRDHGEVANLRAQFQTFAANSRRLLVNAGCAEAAALAAGHPAAVRFGDGLGADIVLEVIAVGPERGLGLVRHRDGRAVDLDLPQPGRHNLENACAAVAAAWELGVDADTIAAALRCFPGVARRFEVVGTTAGGIRVVDDYAHNGEKIRAAVSAAQAGCERLVAVFQPHGFGPARFLRGELKALLPGLLRARDRWCYAGIHYAGGSVAQDISSADLAGDLPDALRCGHAASHRDVLAWVAEEARPGDTVLLMGARDPALPRLARALYELL